MILAFSSAGRKPFGRIAALCLTLLALASCANVPMIGGAGSGGSVDPGAPVPVAMLVPLGDTGGAASVARSLENAARMAVRDLDGAEIDLRVYDTAGDPARAAQVATEAVNDGAQIVLGPLFTQTTAAVSSTLAGRGVNVLSFSNNTALAGGNVYVLGRTFDNIADRLSGYAARQGRNRVVVVHSADVAGEAGRNAIVAAARRNGMTVAGTESYPLSQQGITEVGPRVASAVDATGATALFLTANIDSDLPLLARTLPDAGVDPASVRYIGLTQWDSLPGALALPGLQGGLFAVPDQAIERSFAERYAAAYGAAPHPLAGLAYDGIQAIGALVAQGRRDAVSAGALTQASGFAGATGAFRLLPNGTNERALAVAQIQNNQVVVIDPAPRRFGGAGL